MKVKFKDGTIKECSSPTEQKVFKLGEEAGWISNFALIGYITSNEVDSLIVADNIAELSFISVDENGKETTISLSDYDRVSSAIIRYAEPHDQTRVEIHLTKGLTKGV